MGDDMADNPAVDTGGANGPGTLADIAAAHAEGPDEGRRTGRPAEPIDLSTPEGRARAAKRERDRARYAAKSGRAPSPRIGNDRASIPAAELFKPETCGVLARLPFDIAAARLKSDTWALDKDETNLLAVPLADSLNQFFPETSPKWAAISAFALALLTVTAKKYLTWKEEKGHEENPA